MSYKRWVQFCFIESYTTSFTTTLVLIESWQNSNVCNDSVFNHCAMDPVEESFGISPSRMTGRMNSEQNLSISVENELHSKGSCIPSVP